MIVCVVLFLKLCYPVYAIITDKTANTSNWSYIIVSLFAGMYLNMISILIDLIINEDLKGRRYILNVMETLIAH